MDAYRGGIWGLVVLCLLYCGTTTMFTAVAQEGQTASAELRKAHQAAFGAMMANPTDAERAFEFVQIALQVDDIRGAIAALERILLLKPGLANLQLELGVLYLRVGTPELAETYIRQALEAPDMPEAVRTRAEHALAQARTQVSRHLFTGTLFTGGVYETNATAAPGLRGVRVVGQNGLLDESATAHDDFSVVVQGDLHYAYTLHSQAGHLIEADLLFYNRWYDKSHEINVATVSLEVGPRFFLGPVLDPSLSFRPFVSASYLALDDESYLSTLGGGVNVRKFFSVAWVGEMTLEANHQHFDNSPKRRTASDRTGPFLSLHGSLAYQLLPTTQLSGRLILERRLADKDFEALLRGGLTLAVTQSYAAPFRLTALPWSTSLSAGFLRTAYDAPDPAVDANEKRQETRVDVVLSTNIRLASAWTLVLSAQYSNNNASLPNFDYEDTSVNLGVAWRF